MGVSPVPSSSGLSSSTSERRNHRCVAPRAASHLTSPRVPPERRPAPPLASRIGVAGRVAPPAVGVLLVVVAADGQGRDTDLPIAPPDRPIVAGLPKDRSPLRRWLRAEVTGGCEQDPAGVWFQGTTVVLTAAVYISIETPKFIHTPSYSRTSESLGTS